MNRTKFPTNPITTYPINQEPIVLSKPLLDKLLLEPNPADLIGLYCFYYYTAKWQNTNRPKATINYTSTGIRWGNDKVRAVKKRLKQLKLIEDITVRNELGRITGHYVKVNFIWKSNTIEDTLHHPMDFTKAGILPGLAKPDINALSTNNKNALNTIILPADFPRFWKLYPKKVDKGKALTSWNKLCNKKDRPTFKEIKSAIIRQKRSERWQDPKYIPHPTTWLNQSRWLDDPAEMKLYEHKQNNYPKYYIRYGTRWDRAEDGEYRNSAGQKLAREEYTDHNGKILMQ